MTADAHQLQAGAKAAAATAGKILSNAAAQALAVADEGVALAVVGKVTGQEIMAAIAASTGDEQALDDGANAAAANQLAEGAKAAAVAGGIVLRSLVKDGKLAVADVATDKPAAKRVGQAAGAE
ncbi:variable large family protein (plasmid) [Borrelia sp. RT1S]|nr:variable large family protein [Borrelia sp. RT1S]UGQ17761.2 variable large family protein [Borrelia sp. RT1S]